MDKKQVKTGCNRNKLTTNKQVIDMSLALWECSEYLAETLMRTNLNSYFRDRVVRLIQRLQREAIRLGGDLSQPNTKAFISIRSTREIAKSYGLLD